MSGPSSFQPQNSVLKWIERRLPIFGLVHSSFVAYPTPRNLNYWWTFGGILSFMLGGADHHRRHPGDALHAARRPRFQLGRSTSCATSNYGWLLRYLHSNGASMFFIAVYIHMLPRPVLRLLQGAARDPLDPRRHHLPPDDGDRLHGLRAAVGSDELLGRDRHHQPVLRHSRFRRKHRDLLWGGYSVGNPTLNRFFSLHYLLPFMIAGVVVLHVWALHVAGQNNPTGVEPKTAKDTVPFTPYATIKDAFGLSCFILFYLLVRLLHPELSRRSRQLHPGQPGVTPAHIVPEWYYPAVLRDPARDPGQARGRGGDVRRYPDAGLPALARHFARCARCATVRSPSSSSGSSSRSCLGLGYLGAKPPEGVYVIAGRILTALLFRLFPDRAADAGPYREAAAVAEFDRR